MLDNVHPAPDLLAAIDAWKPDPACLAALAEHVGIAIRCGAAAGLSDAQIAAFVRDLASVSTVDDTTSRQDAAIAVARHCAMMGLPPRQIVAHLMRLEAEVPCWPDADEVASIVQGAIAEFS
jgi:hypothetical protein